MYKKIVFATDLNISDELVINKVSEIVKINDAELVLCHINQIALVEPAYMSGFGGNSSYGIEDSLALKVAIANMLDEFISRDITKIKFVSDISFNIAYTITHDVYEHEHNDLIIVVEHEKKGLGHRLGGFVGQITKASKADVLVIKPQV